MVLFGTPTSKTVDNILGLYDGPSARPLVNVPKHLQEPGSPSILKSILKLTCTISVLAGFSYFTYSKVLIPRFGSSEDILKYIWEGEEPEKWRWEAVVNDVEKRLTTLVDECSSMETLVKENGKKLATSAEKKNTDSYQTIQKTKGKLSHISHKLDEIASDIDRVKAPKNSDVRRRKKFCSERIVE